MTDDFAAVYVQTNEPDANRVVAYRRGPDGSLETLGAYETAGAGDGVPSAEARAGTEEN